MNIIRLYNQNRKQLFIVILIVVSVILAIRFVNYLVIKDNEEKLNDVMSSSSTNNATTTYKPEQSPISSSSVSSSTYKLQSELIDKFMKNCNEGNTKEAYNLLSNDCKTVLFPTLEHFINNYQKQIFIQSKLYSIKNWIGSTYKINITENILATGKSNNGITMEDYFTIVNEDNENKLNINGFISRRQINKSNSKNNVNIEVLYKDTYMDYTTYTIKATNNTDKTILLDSKESTQKMYIIDSNNTKYTSYSNEIPTAELKVLPYSSNTIKIKYASVYVSKRQIASLIFGDVILDYNTYEAYTLKKDYTNRASIKVEL